MTDREAGWKPTKPAAWSLARMRMMTVSELGRIRLPPSVLTKAICMVSLSSGSLSSVMNNSMVFFTSPLKRSNRRDVLKPIQSFSADHNVNLLILTSQEWQVAQQRGDTETAE